MLEAAGMLGWNWKTDVELEIILSFLIYFFFKSEKLPVKKLFKINLFLFQTRAGPKG